MYSPRWTSTTYTLLLLHWLGLPPGNPQALAGCRQLWDGARYYDGGLNLAKSIREPETCITAMLVLLASTFGFHDERVDQATQWLLDQRLADGGWNCETVRAGSTHGSFHTSISALDALLSYRQSCGPVLVGRGLLEGQQFFLEHRLWHSHRTGAEVDPTFRRFPFPPQWHFDVLRGLEHFRAADAVRDERLADGIALLRRTQRPDGTWRTYADYPGRSRFRMEEPGPSRWTTLRARRVLAWWEGGIGG